MSHYLKTFSKKGNLELAFVVKVILYLVVFGVAALILFEPQIKEGVESFSRKQYDKLSGEADYLQPGYSPDDNYDNVREKMIPVFDSFVQDLTSCVGKDGVNLIKFRKPLPINPDELKGPLKDIFRLGFYWNEETYKAEFFYRDNLLFFNKTIPGIERVYVVKDSDKYLPNSNIEGHVSKLIQFLEGQLGTSWNKPIHKDFVTVRELEIIDSNGIRLSERVPYDLGHYYIVSNSNHESKTLDLYSEGELGNYFDGSPKDLSSKYFENRYALIIDNTLLFLNSDYRATAFRWFWFASGYDPINLNYNGLDYCNADTVPGDSKPDSDKIAFKKLNETLPKITSSKCILNVDLVSGGVLNFDNNKEILNVDGYMSSLPGIMFSPVSDADGIVDIDFDQIFNKIPVSAKQYVKGELKFKTGSSELKSVVSYADEAKDCSNIRTRCNSNVVTRDLSKAGIFIKSGDNMIYYIEKEIDLSQVDQSYICEVNT